MTDRQMLVLRSLFIDHEAVKRFLPVIRPEHFGTEQGARFLCQVFMDHYRKYGQMPSQEEAYLGIRDTRGPRQEVEDEAIDLLKQCHAERDQRPNPEWLEHQVHRFLDDAEAMLAVTAFITDENGDDPKRPRDPEQLTSERLLKAIAPVYDIRQMLADRPLAGLGFDTPQYVWDRLHSRQQRFATGLPTLDDLTGGGLARTQVGIIVAGSGVGKSMLLCHLAAEALRGGASVLYLNLESEDVELQTRIVCNLMNMSSHTYKRLDAEQMAEVHQRNLQCALRVRDLVVSSKPSDLTHAAEEFRWAEGKYPDVIIVDYLGELEAERQSKNDTTYTTGAGTVKNLMKLGKRTNAAIWTAAQVNREGLKKSKNGSKEKPDATNMADSIAPFFKSTLVGNLTLIPQKHGNDDVGFLHWSTQKYRFKAARPEMIVRLDYPYARFQELDEKQVAEVLANAAGAETVEKEVVKQDPQTQWAFNMDRGERRRNIAKLKVD